MSSDPPRSSSDDLPLADHAASVPAMSRQAPGVRGAHQIPTDGVTLQTGDLIGGKFEVRRYLGSSQGAVSYLCRDTRRARESVVKVIDLSLMPPACQEVLTREVPQAARLQSPHLSALYGMGQVDARHAFVAMEYIQGGSLAKLIAQRREHRQRSNLRDVFTVTAYLSRALKRIHGAGMIHGVITPYNVMLTRHGELKLGNLAFGRASAASLLARGKGPFFDSIYVAPELSREPLGELAASDIYSVAMITVELLSEHGLPHDRAEVKGAISQALSGHPPRLTQLLLRALDRDPTQRPTSTEELLEALAEAARDLGVRLGDPPAEGELPIKPAVAPEAVDEAPVEDDLFDIPARSSQVDIYASGAMFGEEEEDGRYLVQKGGLDYGPFTYNQVVEQLRRDEIDEGTQVLDRITQERARLEDSEAFAAAVAEYVPEREARLRLQAEQRAELQRKVKKGGVAIFVVGIVAGLFVLSGMLYVVFTQPDPKPLPMDRAFASLDFKLLPPPKEFTTVAVDKGLMESIFNPEASEEEIARQLKKIRRKRSSKRSSRGSRSDATGRGAQDEEDITHVDMSDGPNNGKILSDAEVNEEILSQWGALRRCVMKEVNANPSFRGVTVKFFIRPSGTTGGVKIKESKYASKPVGSCLVGRFRAMRFPEHSGFNKGVEFPILLQ